MIPLIAAICFLLTQAGSGMYEHTVTCPIPTHKTYYSQSKEYSFEVELGAKSGEHATGTLLRIDPGREVKKVWSDRLTNKVAPDHVLVSNSGAYVVTIDNWCAAGYGDNVVVIYGPGGRLIRKFGLKSIAAKEETGELVFTADGVRWGEGHYLVEESNTLVLKVITGGADRAPDAREYREVKINLPTGEIS